MAREQCEQMDRQIDRQMDRQTGRFLYTPQIWFARGGGVIKLKMLSTDDASAGALIFLSKK